ncbi:MAG: hypothetical protein RTU30_01055 [Candidatus Thorarchaeota archaeon]
MSMIKMNFSKLSTKKKKSSEKILYYGVVGCFILLTSFFMVPLALELFFLLTFLESLCFLITGWHIFTYRVVSILESVVEKVE